MVLRGLHLHAGQSHPQSKYYNGGQVSVVTLVSTGRVCRNYRIDCLEDIEHIYVCSNVVLQQIAMQRRQCFLALAHYRRSLKGIPYARVQS